MKSVPQPDTIALLGINNCLQIIETGFTERFYASHKMGPAQILLKISTRIACRETYRMILLLTPLFSHWSIPLMRIQTLLLIQVMGTCNHWSKTLQGFMVSVHTARLYFEPLKV
jgi:hypothetical protein